MSDINFNQRLNRLEERRKGSNFSYSFDGLNEDTVLIKQRKHKKVRKNIPYI